MNTKNLSTLKIHKLTKAQYEREKAAGRLDNNAIYLTPEEDVTITSIGAAPAGYGTRVFDDFIPSEYKIDGVTYTSDFDNYVDGGIYGVVSDAQASSINNCPIDRAGRLEVDVSAAIDDSKNKNQYRRQTYETIDGDRVRRIIWSADNGASWTFKPWEWENPPMEEGVEYRTTEKYAEKYIEDNTVKYKYHPVYTRVINCGTTVSGQIAVEPFGGSGITPIRYEGFLTNGTVTAGYRTSLPLVSINESGSPWVAAHAYVSSDKVVVSTVPSYAGKTAYVQVWYVK